MRPSLVIDSGGGFQLIYILKRYINIYLYRPAITDEQKEINECIRSTRTNITVLAHDFETLLRNMIPADLKDKIKIDNMSNLDRVMRLPGTINFPKAEKRAKGQVEALAHIAVDYKVECDMRTLRE